MKDLAGVTSIAYTSGDPVALAKALSKYAKDNPEYTFKAGIVEGRVIAIKDIDALASMPSKEEIYSKLLFLMNAPGAASGDGNERGRPRHRGRHESGRGEEQVWWRGSGTSAPAPAAPAEPAPSRGCRRREFGRADPQAGVARSKVEQAFRLASAAALFSSRSEIVDLARPKKRISRDRRRAGLKARSTRHRFGSESFHKDCVIRCEGCYSA